MGFKTGKIFDERIFGNNVRDIRNFKEGDDVHLIRGSGYLYNVSIFDYILALRLGFVPSDTDDVDWGNCNYQCMSIPMLKKWLRTTVEFLDQAVPVHQDLFYGATMDVGVYHVALFAPPEPYKICCMQWDSYYDLYYLYCGRTESKADDCTEFLEYNRPSRKHSRVVGNPYNTTLSTSKSWIFDLKLQCL